MASGRRRRGSEWACQGNFPTSWPCGTKADRPLDQVVSTVAAAAWAATTKAQVLAAWACSCFLAFRASPTEPYQAKMPKALRYQQSNRRREIAKVVVAADVVQRASAHYCASPCKGDVQLVRSGLLSSHQPIPVFGRQRPESGRERQKKDLGLHLGGTRRWQLRRAMLDASRVARRGLPGDPLNARQRHLIRRSSRRRRRLNSVARHVQPCRRGEVGEGSAVEAGGGHVFEAR